MKSSKFIVEILTCFFIGLFSTSVAQNLYYVTAPHYNDSTSYNFLNHIINQKTTKNDSIVILLDSGVLQLEDTVITEYGLCKSTIKSINALSKENHKILTSGLGSFISEVIKINTNKHEYLDSLCILMTGDNLSRCYGNECYFENTELRDSIVKYSGLKGLDRKILRLSLSIRDPEALISEKLKLIEQNLGGSIKFFYLTNIWSDKYTSFHYISLLPRLILSPEGKVRKNKITKNDNGNNRFNKLKTTDLGRKNYISFYQSLKAISLFNSELYGTAISHPCYSSNSPIPLKSRIKKIRDSYK